MKNIFWHKISKMEFLDRETTLNKLASKKNGTMFSWNLSKQQSKHQF